MTAQSVILPLPSDHARFIVLRLKDLSISELKQQIEALLSTRDRLITQHPNDQIKTAIAFGPELWSKLYSQTPEDFRQLDPQQGLLTCLWYPQMCLYTLRVLVLISALRSVKLSSMVFKAKLMF
jgi:hypothetical protein